MKRNLVLISILSCVLSSCFYYPGYWNVNQEFHIASVNNNVCKKLSGNVVVYAIFVESKYTNPWSQHDIYSTLDSLRTAMNWVEDQAADKGVGLSISVDYHQDEDKVIPIEEQFAKKTLSKTLFSSSGVKLVDKWADKAAKTALKTFEADATEVTKTKIKPKDRERLIARLRDKHGTDNVALIYFINNYYTDEVSCAIHCSQDDSPEYAIVSFKQPGVIAHEFLHLFGAWDLYATPYDTRRKARKKRAFALKEFPDEIMAFAYRNIDSLSISPLTEYLVGWDNELDDEFRKMILYKRLKVAKY